MKEGQKDRGTHDWASCDGGSLIWSDPLGPSEGISIGIISSLDLHNIEPVHFVGPQIAFTVAGHPPSSFAIGWSSLFAKEIELKVGPKSIFCSG
jgi:hypothetical protein